MNERVAIGSAHGDSGVPVTSVANATLATIPTTAAIIRGIGIIGASR